MPRLKSALSLDYAQASSPTTAPAALTVVPPPRPSFARPGREVVPAAPPLYDLVSSRIIACIPVYKEDRETLLLTIDSFRNMDRRFALQMVLVVDGCEEALGALESILGLEDAPAYVTNERYRSVRGTLPSGEGGPGAADAIPFTLIFKHRNAGKRDSHLLFLESLKRELVEHLEDEEGGVVDDRRIEAFLEAQNLSILMVDSDTGFEPGAVALLQQTLWHPENADACGAAGISLPRWRLQRPLDAAQNFEYRAGQFCDKAAQSTLGFVLCLQGAFCLYRASDLLQSDVLREYGKKATSILEINKIEMGEDRYLTTLLLRKGRRALYVSESRSYTTPPDTLASLLVQRRRWQNCTLANLVEIATQFTAHDSPRRKAALAWTRVSIVAEMLSVFLLPLLLFRICFAAIRDAFELSVGETSANLLFFGLLLALVLVSQRLHPARHPRVYGALNALLCGASLTGLGCLVAQLVETLGDSPLRDFPWAQTLAALGVTFAWVLPAVRMAELNLALIYSWACYFLYVPFYFVTMPIYACANFCDVSWGTRGMGTQAGRQGGSPEARRFRLGLLSLVFLCNAATALLFSARPSLALCCYVVLLSVVQVPKLTLALLYRVPRRSAAVEREERPARAQASWRRRRTWGFQPVALGLSLCAVYLVAGAVRRAPAAPVPLVTRSEFTAAVEACGYRAPPANAYEFLSLAGPVGGITDKRQLAMFLANVLHESAGLHEKRERGCPGGAHCGGYLSAQNVDDPLFNAHEWYGRGYIQLSWDFNYRAASRFLFGDDRLVRNPELVADDDQVAWSTAFWFWRKQVAKNGAVRAGHFGASVLVVNGPTECNLHPSNRAKGARVDEAPFDHRAALYRSVLAAFGEREAPDVSGCN